MKKTFVRCFHSSEEMASSAAELIRETAHNSIARQGFFTLVLSGGKTPEKLFPLLAKKVLFTDMPWDKTYLFWGDERFVSAESADSNFKTANDLLLSKINIPERNIYNMIGNMSETPETNAEQYESKIRQFFHERRSEIISFDLVLLGMGNDGHTASIFPNSAVISENKKLVCAVPAPKAAKPAVPRITMTFQLLNSSRNILFLISGPEKKTIMEKILSSNANIAEIPAAGITPKDELVWYVS